MNIYKIKSTNSAQCATASLTKAKRAINLALEQGAKVEIKRQAQTNWVWIYIEWKRG